MNTMVTIKGIGYKTKLKCKAAIIVGFIGVYALFLAFIFFSEHAAHYALGG